MVTVLATGQPEITTGQYNFRDCLWLEGQAILTITPVIIYIYVHVYINLKCRGTLFAANEQST